MIEYNGGFCTMRPICPKYHINNIKKTIHFLGTEVDGPRANLTSIITTTPIVSLPKSILVFNHLEYLTTSLLNFSRTLYPIWYSLGHESNGIYIYIYFSKINRKKVEGGWTPT